MPTLSIIVVRVTIVGRCFCWCSFKFTADAAKQEVNQFRIISFLQDLIGGQVFA